MDREGRGVNFNGRTHLLAYVDDMAVVAELEEERWQTHWEGLPRNASKVRLRISARRRLGFDQGREF